MIIYYAILFQTVAKPDALESPGVACSTPGIKKYIRTYVKMEKSLVIPNFFISMWQWKCIYIRIMEVMPASLL